MATVEEVQVSAEKEDLRPKKPLHRILGTAIRKYPLGAAGLAVVVLMVIMGVFAGVIAPYPPEEADWGAMMAAPSPTHWLGTDDAGRDILSRIIYGAQTALLVGLSAAFVGAIIGLVLGVTSAYLGGWFDLLFQRFMDVFMAFPLIILSIAIVATLGNALINVIIAITIPFIPRCARVVRSNALSIREIPYVDAARAMGFSHVRIILRHMAPNVMAPFLIMLTAFVGQAILLEASLSFLGLGVQEPRPAWGLMLRAATEFAEDAPWIPIFPGLAITIAVFGFNLFGDAVRDALDPRLRTQ